MGVIMINALVIGLETMDSLKKSHGQLFQIVDELFLSIYTVEFLLKLYAEPKGYWKSSYNRFDFLILFISYIQAILDMINVGDNVLKPLRLLRGNNLPCIYFELVRRYIHLFITTESTDSFKNRWSKFLTIL